MCNAMKIGILGHLGQGQNLLNGQTIKTNNLIEGLEQYSSMEVFRVDSHGWSKHPFRLLGKIKTAFAQCDCVVMLPAHNGVKVFAPVLLHYKKKYGKKIFYDVIGGWLPELVKDRPSLKKTLKAFDGIWVETQTMKDKLEAQGFENVTVVPNFKKITPLKEAQLVYPQAAPYKLCTFSRVMKEKGIEDAVMAVKAVNETMGNTVYTLDIYGQVDAEQNQWFEDLQKTFPDYIRYAGAVQSDQSVAVLKDYFALLFPTRFYTEGIPGTIIDAYAAGIPVISARWASFADVVQDRKTGFGYDFEDTDQLLQLLLTFARQPEACSALKENCLHKAQDYTMQRAMEILQKQMQ